jgi:hypothetical protein
MHPVGCLLLPFRMGGDVDDLFFGLVSKRLVLAEQPEKGRVGMVSMTKSGWGWSREGASGWRGMERDGEGWRGMERDGEGHR